MKRFGSSLYNTLCCPASTLLCLLGCIVSGLISSSCTDRNHSPSTGQIRCCLMVDPPSLDPRIAGTARIQTIFEKLFEGLLRKDKDEILQPGLAKAVLLSEDKKTYTFLLRPTKWSNGSSVTAYDFEYAWKSVISKNVQTKHASVFFCIKNAKKAFDAACSIDQVGIRVVDDLTLQVELEHPAPYFLEWVANPLYSPICRSCLGNKMTMDAIPISDYVCNGPYMLTGRTVGQQIDLAKNPLYWNPAVVKNEGIQFFVLADPVTAYSLFCTGELDRIGDPLSSIPPEIADALARQHQQSFSKKRQQVWLTCNTHLKYLSSAKIRKAIASAINRGEITSNLFQNRSFPSYSVVSSNGSLIDHSMFNDHDAKSAQKLFSEGLADLGYTKETYPDLTLSCRLDPSSIAACELIAQQLHIALGITVHIQPKDPILLTTDMLHNHFELTYFYWISYLNDPIYNLECFDALGGGFLRNGWENQTYTDLLQASNNEEDPEKRKELLKKAETCIMEELPAIPILEESFFFAQHENVQEDF